MLEKIKRVFTDKKDKNVNITLEVLRQKTNTEIETILNYLDYIVENINKTAYQVGDIFLSVNDTNPKKRFGGEWILISKGRTLVGVNPEEDEYNSSQKIGGKKEVILDIKNIPEHAHNIAAVNPSEQGFVPSNGNNAKYQLGFGTHIQGYPTKGWLNYIAMSSTGESEAFDIRQPYFTCYIWQKIA